MMSLKHYLRKRRRLEMSERQVKEISPGVFNENGEFVFDPTRVVAEGTKRGVALIGEIAANRKALFDEDSIKKLHKAVVYYLPGIAGQYRLGEDVRIGGHRLVSGRRLKDRMHLFGRWLRQETENLRDRPEDLLGALRLACEAHYGLVSPELHPFDDGNGRVARLLANGILMMNAHELVFYGIKILPIPLVRKSNKGREDPYIRILEEINSTRVLNPLEVYMATLWFNNLTNLVEAYSVKVNGQNKKSGGDKKLIEKFKNRGRILKEFIADQTNKNRVSEVHIVPDYSALQHIKG